MFHLCASFSFFEELFFFDERGDLIAIVNTAMKIS